MLNQVIRMAMNMLVSKGINKVAQGGKDPQDMTAEERRSAQSKRQNMGRARKATNILRRFMR